MSLFSHKKRILAVDIHDTDIRVAQLNNSREISYLESIPLPEKSFQKGKILNKESIVNVLGSRIKNIHPLPDAVVFSIPDASCFIHTISIKSGLDGELKKEAITAEAEKIIPVNHDEVYFDYSEGYPQTAEMETILYVAALRSVVDEYRFIAEKSGVNSWILDCEGLAFGRSLLTNSSLEPNKNSLTTIVTIGDDITTIDIFNENHLLLVSSTVPFSGGYFTKSIVKSLRVIAGDGSASFSQLKLETTDEKGNTVLKIALSSVVDEIKKAIRYVEVSINGKMGTVILAGELAMIPTIETYFTALIGVPTIIGNPLGGLMGKQLSNQESAILYAGALGLALRNNREDNYKSEINLFQMREPEIPSVPSPSTAPITYEKKISHTESWAKKLVGILFVLITLGALGFVLYTYLVVPLMRH